MKKLVYLLVFLGLFLAVACERNLKKVGGVTERASDPTYQVALNRATTPSASDTVLGATQETAVEAVDGSALYQTHCMACHQMNGQGIPGAFPPLDGSKYVTGDNVARMAAIMIYGLQGPITVKGQQYNSAMAPLGQTLNNEQLAAVATYIRSAWSNTAGPVEEKVFADVRAQYGTRGMFTIEELGAD